jgi:hypothetical protein
MKETKGVRFLTGMKKTTNDARKFSEVLRHKATLWKEKHRHDIRFPNAKHHKIKPTGSRSNRICFNYPLIQRASINSSLKNIQI